MSLESLESTTRLSCESAFPNPTVIACSSEPLSSAPGITCPMVRESSQNASPPWGNGISTEGAEDSSGATQIDLLFLHICS